MYHVQDRIARALAALGVEAGHALGVACSGGPDSAALAHACLTLARRGALGRVVLLHVHHGLRPDADRDAEVVRALAAQGHGQAVIRAATVDRDRASLEAAARDARYAVLDQLAIELGLRWILTAHTASDQAETVLMRVMRGTGVHGLAGIPAARGRYLRPLLDTTRAEIEDYCRSFEVPAVADPMNQDPAFLRNRVRARWLPALRAENPRIDEALCRLATAAADQRSVLEYAAATLLERARGQTPAGLPAHAVALDVAALQQAPAAVRSRAASRAAAGAGLGPLAARHLRALDALVTRPAAGSARLSLPGGTATREYDRLIFARWIFAGRAGQAVEMTAEMTAASLPEPAPGPPEVAPEIKIEVAPEAELAVEIHGPDAPYRVRRWQPGDRMRPVRLRGRSRKLGDLFIDARVPRRLRGRAVVVIREADGAIVWAQHIGPAFGCEISVSLTPGTPLASNKVSDRR
jgi:tRNA(Ile)-lysidine synthase